MAIGGLANGGRPTGNGRRQAAGGRRLQTCSDVTVRCTNGHFFTIHARGSHMMAILAQSMHILAKFILDTIKNMFLLFEAKFKHMFKHKKQNKCV